MIINFFVFLFISVIFIYGGLDFINITFNDFMIYFSSLNILYNSYFDFKLFILLRYYENIYILVIINLLLDYLIDFFLIE